MQICSLFSIAMAYKKRWEGFFDLFDNDNSGFVTKADVKGATDVRLYLLFASISD